MRARGFSQGPGWVIFVILFMFSYVLVPAARYFEVAQFESFPLPDDFDPVGEMSAIVVALCAFMLGGISSARHDTSVVKRTIMSLDPGRALVIHVFCLVIGIFACGMLMAKAGASPLDYFMYSNYYRLEVNNDMGGVKGLINLSTVSGLLLYVAQPSDRVIGARQRIMLALVFYINLVYAHRFVAVAFLISLAFAHHRFRSKLSIWDVSKLLIALLVFNAVYASFRDAMHSDVSDSQDLADIAATSSEGLGFAIASFLSFQFHGLTSMIHVRRLIEDGAMGFHWGWHYLYDMVFSVVPYSIYPEKYPPISTIFNMRIRGEMGDTYDPAAEVAGGIVLGFVGDYYYAGGLLFVALGSYLFARFVRWIDAGLSGRLGPASFFVSVVLFPYVVLSVQGVGGLLPRGWLVGLFALFLIYLAKRRAHAR
jgi:hypothetical protein